MYLISAYFDEITNNRIQQYINQVAKKTGNTYMLDGKVPPHITISSFESKEIQQVIPLLEQTVSGFHQETIQWTSVSAFLPYVLYLSPVLNVYLHGLSEKITSCLEQVEGIRLSPYYQPFSWMILSNAVLTVSCIGYRTQEIQLNGQSVQNFFLEEDTEMLSEVVVVGYGQMKRADLTGAVASVGDEAISKSVVTSIDQVLQGRSAKWICMFVCTMN